MIGLASTFGILSSVIGLFFSYSYNLAKSDDCFNCRLILFIGFLFLTKERPVVFCKPEKEMEESTNEKI